MNDNQKEMIVDTLKNEIPQLQALYLFGSFADGSATTKSDVDIAYLSSVPLETMQKWELSQKLASMLSLDVDLVDLTQTNTIFRFQIISKGVRIYGEGYEVERFETLAYSFYLRFQEERQPIVDEICKDSKRIGKEQTIIQWNLNKNDIKDGLCVDV